MILYVSIILVKVITTRQGRYQRVELQIPTPSPLSKNILPIQVVLPKTNFHLPQGRNEYDEVIEGMLSYIYMSSSDICGHGFKQWSCELVLCLYYSFFF